jgi:hypothetical protein
MSCWLEHAELAADEDNYVKGVTLNRDKIESIAYQERSSRNECAAEAFVKRDSRYAFTRCGDSAVGEVADRNPWHLSTLPVAAFCAARVASWMA